MLQPNLERGCSQKDLSYRLSEDHEHKVLKAPEGDAELLLYLLHRFDDQCNDDRIPYRPLLQEDQIDLVIQINGKKRSVLNVKKGISEKDLFEIAKKDKILDKYLSNNEIKKIIFVKDRLMNILIND